MILTSQCYHSWVKHKGLKPDYTSMVRWVTDKRLEFKTLFKITLWDNKTEDKFLKWLKKTVDALHNE